MNRKCDKNQILKHLRRASGQVQGIERMVEDDREIADILQQLNASSQALKSVARLLLEDYAAGCFSKKESQQTRSLRRLIEQMFKVM